MTENVHIQRYKMTVSKLVYLTIAAIVCISDGTSAVKELFEFGKEYRYSYQGLFTTGTEEPTSYASSYKLQATLRLQGISYNVLHLKLDEISIGLYNGKWSYFPVPDFKFIRDEGLEALQEPFQLHLNDDGEFKTLIMNDQEPEFASNIKRGLATYLQMNLTTNFDSVGVFKELELTTMGECPTSFEITRASSNNIRIGKFRNHADCPDLPTRTRYGNKAYYSCSNDRNRDIINSTSYAVYDVSDADDRLQINSVIVLSSVLYWPFTSTGQFLYSWYNLTLTLEEAGPITNPIPGPENAETHEDLSYVFEQSDYQDPEEDIPDLKSVEPMYFHQTLTESDPESLEKLSLMASDAVKKVAKSITDYKAFNDLNDFHANSPLSISRALSLLDYESLKNLYANFSIGAAKSDTEKALERQLFIDGLLSTGSSAPALLLRDILLETEDPFTISLIASVFPAYIRNPSETLMKELDAIFAVLNKESLGKTSKRQIEYALATLVSRCCEKNLCVSSGLLDKYILYFEAKLENAETFEDQTAAIHGLRNIKVGRSLNKLVDISLGKTSVESSVRVQAIWSLRPLFYTDSDSITQQLLQVFFDRKQSCEIRTSVFGLLMSANPQERVLHEIAYYMWSETCPQTLNVVRSSLTLMAKSISPCNRIQSFAQTVLKYLPPGSVDPTRTTSYALEYYDAANGFGRSTYATVQKSGKTALPVSIYFGSSEYIGGFASSRIGVFVRLQGLGKFATRALYPPDETSVEKILTLLAKLKMTSKVKSTPFKLELTLLYNDRVVYFYAVDEKSLHPSILQAVKKVRQMQEALSFSDQRSVLLGEFLYQQPLEVGIPISILTSGIISAKLKVATTADFNPNGKEFFLGTDSQINIDAFAETKISNHVPATGTTHSVSLLRTFRARSPRNVSISGKPDKFKVNFAIYPPNPEHPIILQNHATARTAVESEYLGRETYQTLLKSSCPKCNTQDFVSKGLGSAKTEPLVSLPRFIQGMQGGVKTFKCEKQISKGALFKRMKYFVDDSSKNSGIFDTSWAKMILSLQHANDYILYWPNSDPCGITMYLSQNFHNATRRIDKIEGYVSAEYYSKSPSDAAGSITIDSGLKTLYNGSSRSANIHIKISHESQGFQAVRVKGTLTGQDFEYNRVLCVDIDNQASISIDPLGFEGENEPTIHQNISIKLGKVFKADPSYGQDIKKLKCVDNQLDLSIQGKAERSQAQVEESRTYEPKTLPYLFCLVDRISGSWPPSSLPPTADCREVAFDQTTLRQQNFTVTYKASREVQKRWSRPLAFIDSLLSPYLVDSEEAEDDDTTTEGQSSSDDYAYGKVDIDVNLRKVGPVMDIHSSGPSKVDKHYENIDMTLIPEEFRLQPTPSRFSYLKQFLYKAGIIGTCTVGPDIIVTYDNLKYPGILDECETLITSDCGDSPVFSVTARKQNGKIVLVAQIEVDLIEITSQGIQLNKREVNFNNDGEYTERSLMFIKKGADYSALSHRRGIHLRNVDGTYIQVTVPSNYRGVTCGLCGNFDTTSSNDLKGPSLNVTCQQAMLKDWTIHTPSGSCADLPKPTC